MIKEIGLRILRHIFQMLPPTCQFVQAILTPVSVKSLEYLPSKEISLKSFLDSMERSGLS
jgi:hypothetical protein